MQELRLKQLGQLSNNFYSRDNLKRRVGEITGSMDFDISWNCYSDGGLDCYDAMINTDDGLAIDIYWLPCKPGNERGNEIYVTEVSVDET